MTKSISPIKAFVETTYLYDMENKDGFSACYIIGISAYKGQSITFTILIDGAYVFSDIPPQALHQTPQQYEIKLSNKSISHANCPDNKFDLICFEHLKAKKSKAFFRQENMWFNVVEYLYTIDFYEDNLLIHFVKLETGHFVLVPSHKINFSNQEFLPDYKKLRQTWTI